MSGAQSLTFDVVVHAGTALSTIVVFRKDIAELILGVLKFKWNAETKFVSFVLISMLPAAFIGLIFEEQIGALFEGQLLLIGAMLALTGVLLFLADRARETRKSVQWIDAFVVGLAQAVAILPGISRSGATISTSVLLGIARAKAARFSFLMVLPIILGKAFLDAKDIVAGETMGEEVSGSVLIIGLLAAFLSGIVACNWMVALVKRSQLKYFSYYCFVVAAIVLISQLV